MATELQRQVERHRETHFAAFPTTASTPSLFFTSKEAGLIDISAVHEAAVHGLQTLRQYDSRFEVYLDTLLHSSSLSLQRQLQTAEVFMTFFTLYYYLIFVLIGEQSVKYQN